MKTQIFLCLTLTANFGCGNPNNTSRDQTIGRASLASIGASLSGPTSQDSRFLVGTAMRDITGPAAGLATLGYAAPAPEANGIQQRIWARAFYMSQMDEKSEFAYVLTDLCFVPQSIKVAVSQRLNTLTEGRLGMNNIMITANHSHSASGGMSHHKYFNFPSRGFSQQNFDIIVDGVSEAILQASNNKQPGSLSLATGELKDAGINRSLDSYMNNPAEERARYRSSVDESVTLIRMDDDKGDPLGMIHWFAVHGTSIEKDNRLLSGDNKGFASAKFESMMRRSSQSDSFVAAFANSNAGDVSGNTSKDTDGDGDWDCATLDNFDCAAETGDKQVESARLLFDSSKRLKSSRIEIRHQFVDFSKYDVDAKFSGTNTTEHTCSAATGISMLAGVPEDGPGVGTEGQSCSDGSALSKVLCTIYRDDCHGQKPIAVPGGRFSPPWLPNVIPNQLVVIGELAIVAVPGEFTTMAGRRLRETVQKVLAPHGVTAVVIAGYANAYSNYVTTREEYQIQNYEGASTLYGEFTLAAYQQNFSQLAESIVQKSSIAPGPAPYVDFNLHDEAKLENRFDSKPEKSTYGALLKQPSLAYSVGEIVKLEYQSSNPNNDLRHNSSFFEVQRFSNGVWIDIATDNDWNTKFIWHKGRHGRSTSELQWKIPRDTRPGTYRFKFRGLAKPSDNVQVPYENTSNSFESM